jgi:membrane-associated protein
MISLKNMGHWHYYGEILTCSENFTPIVAGIVKMDKKEFLRDNIIGAVLWSFILIFAGHYLDKLLWSSLISILKKNWNTLLL